MAIAENDALFTLIGTTYGGDGQDTFGLPDLRGRVPVHQGLGNYILGMQVGVENVTITSQQTPVHNHAMIASTDVATQITAGGGVPAATPALAMYYSSAADSALNGASLTPQGGSQPHENMMPYLCINFIISLFGIFPSQN